MSYLGRLEEAIAAYEQAVKLNPKNDNAKLNRDNCIVALKMHCEKYKKKGSINGKVSSEYVGKDGGSGNGGGQFASTTSPY